MRSFGRVSLCCLLGVAIAVAQRGGGGMRGGGGYGTGMRGGVGGGNLGAVRGSFIGSANLNRGVGPTRAGSVGLVLPNRLVINGVNFPPSNLVSFPFGLGPPSIPLVSPNGFGFPNGLGVPNFNSGFFFNRGFNNGWYGGMGGWSYGSGGIGLLSPDSSYTPGYNYFAYDPRYASYQQPNVAVVYSTQPAVQPASAERGVHSVIREYDQSGREVPPAGFPLYLIAFADHTIHTAISYRVDGNTLNYLTPERDQKAVPLNAVDRALSRQLNRERQVPFELPP